MKANKRTQERKKVRIRKEEEIGDASLKGNSHTMKTKEPKICKTAKEMKTIRKRDT
jgi:hypothetical protein